jgi:GxxExxY protein
VDYLLATNGHESADRIIEVVIGAAYEVSNELGCGFLEKVYERAILREIASRGLSARSQVLFTVAYKGQTVGEYVADMVVADEVVVELKCVDQFCPEHTAQCINYLKASGLRFALLINFQHPKVKWKRIVYG